MSKEDYMLYREDLSFDQLCAAYGRVFIEFFDLFNPGRCCLSPPRQRDAHLLQVWGS